LNFAALFSCADQGDRVAQEIRDHSLKIWSACALSLVHAYDPELLVLGGGVMNSEFPVLESITKHLDSYAWTPWGRVKLVPASLGNEAALLGAVPLFQQIA